MKPLAILSNLFYPVSTELPGGIETFNYYLTKELTRRGNWDVTLYAAGDSTALPELSPVVERSTLYSQNPDFLAVPWNYRRLTVDEFGRYAALLQQLSTTKPLVHFSLVNFLPFYLAVKNDLPAVTTLHASADNLHYQWLQKLLTPDELARLHIIAVSEAQAKLFGSVHKVIHNGISGDEFQFSETGRSDFIWIGRLTQEKGCAVAAQVASRVSVGLTMVIAPTNKDEKSYFLQDIQPYLSDKIKIVNQLSVAERKTFYHGRALLMPILWEEPFGLVMIEALASGTPVIAFDRGAVREIIDEGRTGFICPADDLEAFGAAIKRMADMPEIEYQQMRRQCRAEFEKRFTIQQMTDQYEQVYQEVGGE